MSAKEVSNLEQVASAGVCKSSLLYAIGVCCVVFGYQFIFIGTSRILRVNAPPASCCLVTHRGLTGWASSPTPPSQTKTGIGSLDTEAEGHKLNGHNIRADRVISKSMNLRTERAGGHGGGQSDSGLMTYLLWIVVIAVAVVGGLVAKSYFAKKKQNRFTF